MTHLGSRLSALVDGQLSPAEGERVLEHVAGCPQCAEELAAARAARRTLCAAADVEPAPDLTARLLALSAQIPSSDDDPLRRPPAAVDPWATPGAPAVLPRGEWRGEVRERTIRRRLAALVVGGVGAAAVGLFALGQTPTITPSLHRSDPLTVLAQAPSGASAAGVGASGQGSGTTELSALAARGWTRPTALPDDVTVVAVRDERDLLEIDLRTPGGEAVVRERVGVLDSAALAGVGTWDVDGRTVHVLSEEPWHVVWQSGDTVVDVVADTGQDDLADLVASFPARDYDAGVPARISRGWTTMTGAIGTP
ncbi:zf-HC2 domain-containing protein [Cellulosimicrobium sp. NPDC057127]|uniref:zf-HC2 domain-containing protein n=1 Tax=Cellulosimicrobium sp. NPDC057127 TaxID=3346026 RepID=UPI003635FC29